MPSVFKSTKPSVDRADRPPRGHGKLAFTKDFSRAYADIVATKAHGHGLVGAFTAGCPITLAVPRDKVHTIAGMAHIAAEGELYLNLHTEGQMSFGDTFEDRCCQRINEPI